MAVIGYITKKDLSSWGTILLMALIGLIVGSIVNIIWFNEAIYWLITGAGIIIFCGLTVYDMNRLKQISSETADENDSDRYCSGGGE